MTFRSLFASYVPVIDAYLNSEVDAVMKTWDHVVNAFFTLNTDETVSVYADLAKAYNSAEHPSFFRIHADDVQKYFEEIRITPVSLARLGCVPKVDFEFDDNHGLRLTFEILRQLIYRNATAEAIEAFGFIDKIYQMYRRYQFAMTSRTKRATHWTLVERLQKIPASMSPQLKPNAVTSHTIMDNQPKAYVFLKGSLHSIHKRLEKYAIEYETVRTFANETAVPIYETVLSNIDEEIASVIGFLEEFRLKPHRDAQVDSGAVSSLDLTKWNIKPLKTAILLSVDDSEGGYSIEDLQCDIEEVQRRLQHGIRTHSKIKLANIYPLAKELEGKGKISVEGSTNKQTVPNTVTIDPDTPLPESDGPMTIDYLGLMTVVPQNKHSNVALLQDIDLDGETVAEDSADDVAMESEEEVEEEEPEEIEEEVEEEEPEEVVEAPPVKKTKSKTAKVPVSKPNAVKTSEPAAKAPAAKSKATKVPVAKAPAAKPKAVKAAANTPAIEPVAKAAAAKSKTVKTSGAKPKATKVMKGGKVLELDDDDGDANVRDGVEFDSDHY